MLQRTAKDFKNQSVELCLKQKQYVKDISRINVDDRFLQLATDV